jgi:adenylate kinase family enzyme
VNIAPLYGERAVIVGMTGSGKTTLARELLRSRQYVVVYDSKGLLRWSEYKRVTSLFELTQSKSPKLLYAPVHSELIDVEIIDKFFLWIYQRMNTTVYVDEVYSVTNRGEIPTYYHAILTRGRELGISTFSSTQRPKQIPQVILSESECYYVFRLLLPQDRQRVKEILPVTTDDIQQLKKHEFLYGNADGSIIGPLRLRLNAA